MSDVALARYESIEHPVIGSGVQSPSRWTLQDVSTWLSSIAAAVLEKDIEPDVDLFAQGFDRLVFGALCRYASFLTRMSQSLRHVPA
jgi:hypothetical protein